MPANIASGRRCRGPATLCLGRRGPPTGTPSTASSSAVPVRTDSISYVPSFRFSPATGQPSFHSSGRISSTLAPPLIQVGFPVHGELLHAVAEIEEAEMAGANHAAAGADQELAAALDHVDAFGIEERAGNFPRPAEADVVAGVRAAAATAMGGQQVIPAIVIHHVGSFAVDGEVAGLIVRVEALAGLGIEFDQPDVAEIGAVGQPQLAVVGIEKDAGSMALESSTPSDEATTPPSSHL